MKNGEMEEHKIRVIIADAQNLFREALRHLLSDEETIQIVGESVSGHQLVSQIRDLSPDVVLLDYNMPDMGMVEIISAVKGNGAKPLALTGETDEGKIMQSLKAGAWGHLSKNSTSDNLVKAIKAVHRGEMWIERKMITRVFGRESAANLDDRDDPDQAKDLSPREHEVLGLLVKGFTNKEIADKLFVSEKTVKNHLNSIFRKISVSGRLKAILYALKRGLY